MSMFQKFFGLLALCLFFATQLHAFPGQKEATTPAKESSTQMTSAKGAVVETMDAGGYTYVCVQTGEKKQWAAIPDTAVKVGDNVEVAAGMVMSNFTSSSLGRTFENIIFSRGLVK